MQFLPSLRRWIDQLGTVKDPDHSALLIDSEIRRIDEIDNALSRTGFSRVPYLLIRLGFVPCSLLRQVN
jgi:hypothetical protein